MVTTTLLGVLSGNNTGCRTFPRQTPSADLPVPLTGRRHRTASSRYPRFHATGCAAAREDSGEIRLWDAESQFAIGEPVRVFADTGPIAFSSDGRFLVVAGREEVAWFDVRVSEWRRFACSLVGDAALSGDDLSTLLASYDVTEACA